MSLRISEGLLIDVDPKLEYDYVLESDNGLVLTEQDELYIPRWMDATLLVKDLTAYFGLICRSEPERQRFLEAILALADVTAQEFATSPVKIGLTLGDEGHLLIDRINTGE
jgi:hypothetical protein